MTTNSRLRHVPNPKLLVFGVSGFGVSGFRVLGFRVLDAALGFGSVLVLEDLGFGFSFL